jgi:Tol biopolymer transport system component
MVNGGDVSWFEISPNSDQVIYRADQETDGINELYLVNIDGSGLIKLSGQITGNGMVSDIGWYPDGSSVFYTADRDDDGSFEFYAVSPDGNVEVQIGGEADTGLDVAIFSFSPAVP